jgi:Ca2+-binding RTX toxin-like protein
MKMRGRGTAAGGLPGEELWNGSQDFSFNSGTKELSYTVTNQAGWSFLDVSLDPGSFGLVQAKIQWLRDDSLGNSVYQLKVTISDRSTIRSTGDLQLTGDDTGYTLAVPQTRTTPIRGTRGDDQLYGSNGNDTIDGGDGDDTMRGGKGNDVYIVNSPGDLIVDSNQTGYEKVIASTSYGLSTGLDELLLQEGDATDGYGNDRNNKIVGNSKNNSLIGELGNDTLIGGAGNDSLNGYGESLNSSAQIDWLEGDSGADKFILGGSWGVSYVESGDGYAVIKDWNAGQGDKIEVFNSPGGRYSLVQTRNVLGSSAKDTEIYFTDANNNRDRIGIVKDTTNVSLSRDFVFS